jgi:sugar diacid utilization regulator
MAATPPTPLTPPSAPIDDVFAFCNHVAWQVGGPVLIHDSAWGVVAYSTLNQAIDEARRAVILRRSVPDRDLEASVLDAIQAQFDAGNEAFDYDAIEDLQQRRVVAPIRLLGVVVGSIWIAESAGPLHPDVIAMARQAAKQASLYFQLRDDVRQREADRFASMLLEGTQDETLLAQFLGVPPATSFRVVTVWHGHDEDLRQQTREVSRILADQRPVSHVRFEAEDRAYFAFYSPDSTDALNQATRTFCREMAAADERLLLGAGRVTTRLAHAPTSKADADKVIAYLQRTPGQRLGSATTLRAQITLMRLVEILDSQFEPMPDALKSLSMLEPEDREDALRTLDAYFSNPGNASEAARQLHVHPNTFRYRLAKVADILGVDLYDRDARLLVELELLRHRYGS